jgi:periplasmic copper chaperone A
MKKTAYSLMTAAAMLLATAQTAYAHVSFVANPAYANKSYIATMNISHGCEDEIGTLYDTLKIEVEIPAGVTSVRPADMPFFTATVTTDDTPAKNVTKITWTKTVAGRDTDLAFYQPVFRAKMPNTPLTTLAFRTTQSCTGDTTIVWEGLEVPKLNVLPARAAGWNKYTAQSDISLATVQTIFSDALIVWSNNTAYSANPVTSALIKTPLSVIPVGADYWVKY